MSYADFLLLIFLDLELRETLSIFFKKTLAIPIAQVLQIKIDFDKGYYEINRSWSQFDVFIQYWLLNNLLIQPKNIKTKRCLQLTQVSFCLTIHHNRRKVKRNPNYAIVHSRCSINIYQKLYLFGLKMEYSYSSEKDKVKIG